MTFELVTIATEADNYNYLLHTEDKTVLVDAPPGVDPIMEALVQRGWGLDEIWITHHDWDHIDGVDIMRERFGARVRGFRGDAHRLPELDVAHDDGDSFDFAGFAVTVMHVPGHTEGHVAYYVPQANVVFTADTLMALGCGKTPESGLHQMYHSVTRLGALPPETVICSGHEYTLANGKFALTIEPDNPDLIERIAGAKQTRATGKPTVPTTLDLELRTNPYLRVGLQSVKDALNMSDASDEAVFVEVRRRKNSF
ncbi:hydroxyacylglutathione hydrolase [Boseongicola aestuarii]|uniref:Hydroxyacylglutathione hydrolase n=1 Tax=Boseongicola aestuarii TaxID=1470561 RepID=A0A238IX15_9RHOB|nr:hydroxyacylglutathione hydrolase [Boseongicola aestuarii]SMX22946.1 Hydroxyacylglutathione hydrolase [Boseongicola aestuarii]